LSSINPENNSITAVNIYYFACGNNDSVGKHEVINVPIECESEEDLSLVISDEEEPVSLVHAHSYKVSHLKYLWGL
jgi:hypothetical protein